jgi:ankyrin repeat protein
VRHQHKLINFTHTLTHTMTSIRELQLTLQNELTTACHFNKIALLKRLLQNPKVDPAYKNNSAIQWASQKGHLAIVDRLLQDERVDPSDKNNDAIRIAFTFGHFAVVIRLLRDERVDPNSLHKLFPCPNIDKYKFPRDLIVILAAKLPKDFPAHSDIISLKPRIDRYREELFAIADDLTVVLDETLDNSGLHRNVWEMVYEYLEHKLPEQ